MANKKPKLKIRRYYDWFDVKEYISDKLGADIEDFAGRFKHESGFLDLPIQDFWHFLLKEYYVEKGQPFVLRSEELSEEWSWTKPIIDLILKEFPGKNKNESASFIADW